MRYLILITFLLFVASCKEDSNPVSVVDLNGQWNFIKATRNGKETKTLDSGFFIFESKDRVIKSNIFNGDKSKSYVLEGNKIDVKGENPMTFNIAYYANDTMVLTGKMWKFNMEFLLLKQDTIAADSLLMF